MKISIVVPIYNSMEYLEKCLNSLIYQTYEDIEILLVNDGSTDGSLDLCEKYKKTDSRIKIINKENGGLSDARNAGLNAASGEYIMFVDSDDYIELDACEKFAGKAAVGQYDIIAGNAKRVDNGKISFVEHGDEVKGANLNGKEFLKLELAANRMNMASCFNMYRRDFIEKNGLGFEKGLLHEDEMFTPRAFLKAQNVISLGESFYNYIIRENSITTKPDKTKNVQDVITICETLQEEYTLLEDEKLQNLLNDHLVNLYLNVFQVARLYRGGYKNLIKKDIVRDRGQTGVNKLRVRIFCLSPKLYYFLNYIRKKFVN